MPSWRASACGAARSRVGREASGRRAAVGAPCARVRSVSGWPLLRQFLYEGFNADEAGRRALDGIIAHIAGAARGSDFNARFARPNGLGYYVASLFPYLDADSRDDVTGKTDGLQSQLAPEQRPKIFYTNTSTEYWGGGRAAALTHTTLDGRGRQGRRTTCASICSPARSIRRVHSRRRSPAASSARIPNEYAWGHRALVVAMERWVRDGVAPPASRHPRLRIIPWCRSADVDFPDLPGVRSPLSDSGRLSGGPRGTARRIRPAVPGPAGGWRRQRLAGIALPDVAVPLATYTGWNFRHPAIGQPGEILPLAGSYIPLPVTRAARESEPRSASSHRGALWQPRAVPGVVADRAESSSRTAICCRKTSTSWWRAHWRGGMT